MHYSENGESSPRSDEDDAPSHYIIFVSEDESDAESTCHWRILIAKNPTLGQPMFLWAMCDTGADVSIISYPKACLIAPEGINDDFAHLKSRSLRVVGGKVTVHGPISVEIWLGDQDSHIRYCAPFYVLPRRYGECGFDALLSRKLCQTIGLVQIQPHPAAELRMRSASRGSDTRVTVLAHPRQIDR
jgi:hypothetical protein